MAVPNVWTWTDFAGQEWACGVYDHGPMCRRCQRVDRAFAVRLEGVRRAELGLQIRMDGAFVFSDGVVCTEKEET